MSTRELQLEQNAKLAQMCEKRLTDSIGEKAPGMCWRFQRLNINDALARNWHCPPLGTDAIGAFEHFKALGWVLPKGANTIPGDLVFFGPTRGNPHGHVAMRVPGNQIGENWSGHYNRRRLDARGRRDMAKLRGVVGWVRIPA